MNSPLLWTSNLQTQIYISNTEAEYITLPTATCEIICGYELLKEVYYIVLKYDEIHTKYRIISKTFETIPNLLFMKITAHVLNLPQ